MSEQEPMQTGIDIDAARSLFSVTGGLTELISDQNNRFQELQTILGDDVEVLDIATQGILGEQQETSLELLTHVEESGHFYSAVGTLSLQAEVDIKESSSAQEALEREYEDMARQVDELTKNLTDKTQSKSQEILQTVGRLSPTALEQVQALLEARTKSAITSSPEIRKLEEDMLEVLSKIDAQKQQLEIYGRQQSVIEELMLEGGKAWPIPLVIMDAFQNNETQQVLIDELPVEPKLRTSSHNRLTALRERYIVDERDASLYIALYLMEHQGQTVSVEDLSHFLYGDEVRQRTGVTDAMLRTRITTLLAPAREYIDKKILLPEGYVLQFGYRRKLEKTSEQTKIVGGRTRIYRAIPIREHDASKLGKQEPGEGYVDEFTEVTVLEDDTITSIETTHDESSIAVDETSTNTEPIPAWVKDFKTQIGETLNRLEGLELLSIDGLSLKQLRTQYDRRNRLTETGLKKLIGAGLLKSLHNLNEERWGEVALSTFDLLVVELFNEHKGPLRKGPLQNTALETIEKAVNAYYEKQSQKRTDGKR